MGRLGAVLMTNTPLNLLSAASLYSRLSTSLIALDYFVIYLAICLRLIYPLR